MKKEKTFKQILTKYFICVLSLIILGILLVIKPFVNNAVTIIYFCVSISGVVLISTLLLIKKIFKLDTHEILKKIIYELTDFFSLFVFACCLFQIFFAFGYFKANVSGSSMATTLANEDVLIVRSTKNVDNFDIVIVSYDSSYNLGFYNEDELLVKRLIGKPGDTLYFDNGVLYLNGQFVDEAYINKELFHGTFDLSSFIGLGVSYSDQVNNYIIDKDYYFVMGDNRNNSQDSRNFGLFHKSQIVGKAAFKVITFTKWEKYNGIDFK